MTTVHILTFIPSNITHCVCKGNCGYLFETLGLLYRKAVNHISIMHHCTQNLAQYYFTWQPVTLLGQNAQISTYAANIAFMTQYCLRSVVVRFGPSD